MKRILMTTLAVALFAIPRPVLAAIGCTLNNPSQDLKSLFPEMTSYKEELRELNKMKDGDKVFQNLKERVGGDLDAVYETIDTPYTVYTVFKGQEIIGVVHGVNVPGKGGVIQTFISTDPTTGEIKNFFFSVLKARPRKR